MQHLKKKKMYAVYSAQNEIIEIKRATSKRIYINENRWIAWIERHVRLSFGEKKTQIYADIDVCGGYVQELFQQVGYRIDMTKQMRARVSI